MTLPVCGNKDGVLPSCAPLANPYVPYQQTATERYTADVALARGTVFEGLDLPLMGIVNENQDKMTAMDELQALGFCVNELLSIIENTSLMGIPYPPAIRKAIEVLQKRASHIDDEIQEMIDDMEDGKK